MKIIGAATGLGAQDPASGKGVDFLFEHNKELQEHWHDIVRTGQLKMDNSISVQEKINYLFPFFNRLSYVVKDVLNKGEFPLVVGGDHSCAIGSWRALLETSPKDVGLLWLDAHLDAHTFETTPSKAIHGMPVACLLGYGEDKFLPKKLLQPENLVIFGARSWEEGEKELLDFLNVRIYFMEEIYDRGMEVCFDEALSVVNRPELDWGISLDLDMFEPTIIQAVCSREDNGIMPSVFFNLFKDRKKGFSDNFKLMEIVEFAPDRDDNKETYKLLNQYINLFK